MRTVGKADVIMSFRVTWNVPAAQPSPALTLHPLVNLPSHPCHSSARPSPPGSSPGCCTLSALFLCTPAPSSNSINTKKLTYQYPMPTMASCFHLHVLLAPVPALHANGTSMGCPIASPFKPSGLTHFPAQLRYLVDQLTHYQTTPRGRRTSAHPAHPCSKTSSLNPSQKTNTVAHMWGTPSPVQSADTLQLPTLLAMICMACHPQRWATALSCQPVQPTTPHSSPHQKG